jgi:tRNA nucleotidyltransferase (CCA-adding enzyme)
MDKEWEASLSVWAEGPGKTEQEKCDRAEHAVKTAIANYPGLKGWDLTVRAHGSYRVNTSITQESDVDIYVRLDQPTFFPEYPTGKTGADFGIVDGTVDYADFRNRVGMALNSRLGERSVTFGGKAFDVHENTYRVDADVIAVFPYRWYTDNFNRDGSHHFHEGIAFRTGSDTRIYSFPDQTYDNGVEKNNATGRRYKRAIRILKNLRTYMDEKYNVAEAKGIASYLIECLVWNVPNENFRNGPYWEDIHRVLVFLRAQTASIDNCREWGEVNELRYLWHSSQLWTLRQAHAFVNAAWTFLEFN